MSASLVLWNTVHSIALICACYTISTLTHIGLIIHMFYRFLYTILVTLIQSQFPLHFFYSYLLYQCHKDTIWLHQEPASGRT